MTCSPGAESLLSKGCFGLAARMGVGEDPGNLSAFAEDHERPTPPSSLGLGRLDKPVDDCYGRTYPSLGEGRCFGGFRRRNEGYHGCKPVEAS